MIVCAYLFHDIQQFSLMSVYGTDGSIWTIARPRTDTMNDVCSSKSRIHRSGYLYSQEMSRNQSTQNDIYRQYMYVDYLYLLHDTTICHPYFLWDDYLDVL